jgi:serralysin
MGRTKAVAGSGYGSVYVDSLVWGGQAWDMDDGPITYYFAKPSDTWWAVIHPGPVAPGPFDRIGSWNAGERSAVKKVLSIIASVCNLTFEEASSASADLVWWQSNIDNASGVHEPPSSSGSWGAFNDEVSSWAVMSPGGFGFETILHELGHGMGLAHPHDGGTRGDATTFPGVTGAYDLGTGNMNQGIWTVMSYNEGLKSRKATNTHGQQEGYGALDIAALQQLYGANMSTRTGDNVYVLPSRDRAGTGWSCIWDAGGTDTISAAGAAKGADIDLRAATLRPGKGAGGFISADRGVSGGFTIAKDVGIERAIGSAHADRITGNGADNLLDGGGGPDRMDGLGGDDTYRVDTARDVVKDTGGGRDTILAKASYALADGCRVEVLSAGSIGGRKALKLTGNSSANTIIGNAGKNVIDGKGGNDVLTGGAGRDTFLFDTRPNTLKNADQILDFSAPEDTVRLDHTVFSHLHTGRLRASAFHAAAEGHAAHDRSDRIIYDTSTGDLYFDPDGTGRKHAVKFAMVDAGLDLTARDFYVV